MDFARPHLLEEGVANRSNIRLISTATDDSSAEKSGAPKDSTAPQSLDHMLVEAANKAAIDMFLGSNPTCDTKLADAKLYPEHVLPTSATIEPHALVVIFESFDNLNFVYATPGEMFSNRNGHFAHNDFIGKPFGCKIRSRNNRGLGYVYLLRPTAELWARTLKHRTQIVHELDASMIVFYLHLRPNMVVCESGTGSGAMSHAIMRTIAPRGMLHTFEFNEMRAQHAREEFVKNKVDHLVTVHHRDVCGKSGSTGGFALGSQVADAVFLDLPEPWLAVPHAAHTLKPSGRIGSYSPCVEQTQRTVVAMQKAGFHSIKTIEARLREHFVDEVELELPPKTKRPRETTPRNTTVPILSGGSAGMVECSGDDTGAEADTELTEAETEATDGVTATAGNTSAGLGTTTAPDESSSNNGKRKRMLCARPFASMRGHTAFLTFATAGNKAQPDPTASCDAATEE